MIAAEEWNRVSKKGDPPKGGRYLVIYKIRVSMKGEERRIETHFHTCDFRPGDGWLTGLSKNDMRIIAWACPRLPEKVMSVDYEEVYAGSGAD